MSKKHLVIEEGPNGSVAMSEISNGTEQVELGHTNLAGMDTPQRRRKLTSISMNSNEGSEAEVAGEESGDDSDKITPKRSKAQQLKDAIMSGDISEVENLLNQKIDVNLSDGFGRSPLHNAVLKGIPSIVDILLKSGADVNKKDDREDSAVHYAARVGNPQVLTLILSNPECDVNLKGSSLNSPLHIAASLNKPDLCQILLEYHANPNSQEENGKSPLGRAVESGAANSAKYLFEHMKGLGIPSDTILYNQDFDGTTLLHLAVDSGFSQVVELCLENGALIRQPRRIDRTTAFHMACEQGSTAIVQLLVQYDPKISKILLVNAEGITPLHQAALSNSHGIAEILINNGADVNARTNENRTPLMFAAKRGGVDTVRLLLEKGADPTLKDIDGRTAVYDAIGYPMTAEVILENTALHLAVKNCRSEIIHLLLSLRKQEILKNTSNQTILDLAVQLDDSAGAMAIAQHDRWREILESCTHGVTNMMKKLCVKMPDVTEQIFDNCIEIEGEKVSQEHKIKYDLGVILRKSSPEVKSSLEILEVIADNRIENCLTHKLTFIALSRKWNSYGWLAFIGSLLSVLVYLIPLTIIHAILEDDDEKYCPSRINESSTGQEIFLLNVESCPKTHLEIQILHYIALIIIAFQIVKECFQIYSKKLSYFKNPINLIELVAFISAIISLIPTCECKWGLQKEAGAVALFFGWINLIMYLQGLPFYGKYVIMLYTMFITLIKVMLLFCLFALAFGTTFHLIIDQDPFTSLPNIMMNMFIMMLGEINYVDTFMPWGKLFYPFMANLVLVLFCLTMPIILMNMLVGLSVGDIDAIERSALIDRYVLQISLLHNLEESFPRWLLRKVQKISFIYFPNKTPSIRKRIFDVLIGFGEVDTEESSGSDEKELHNKVAELQGKLDEQSHTIDDMKSTLTQIFDMMREAEAAREKEERAKAHKANQNALPSLDIGGSLGISMPFGSIAGIGRPFGAKKSEEPTQESTDTTSA